MKKFTHIALMVNIANGFGRAICRGVSRFVQERGEWLLFPMEPGMDIAAVKEWLHKNRIAGVISSGPSREVFLHLKEAGIPLVSSAYRDLAPDVTTVLADSPAVSRLAAEFFLQAGFWNFAFYGYPGVAYSDVRETAFRNLLGEHGKTVHIPPLDSQPCTDRQGYEPFAYTGDRLIEKWLRDLPKPVAVLACNDHRGQQLLHCAQECGIDVPGEMAVLGVDNDDILCTLCHPMLSSIELDGEKIGHAAALALDGLLRKTDHPGNLTLIPPLDVIERQSTGIPPMKNPMMIQALRIIRDSVRDHLTTKGLCADLNCSRTWLDIMFKEHLGRTPSAEINRARLKHVLGLLHGTTLSVKEIATLCGFSSAPGLSRFIRQETGGTARHLRKRMSV